MVIWKSSSWEVWIWSRANYIKKRKLEYDILLALVSLGVGIVNENSLCSYFKALWLLILSFQTHWKRKDLKSERGCLQWERQSWCCWWWMAWRREKGDSGWKKKFKCEETIIRKIAFSMLNPTHIITIIMLYIMLSTSIIFSTFLILFYIWYLFFQVKLKQNYKEDWSTFFLKERRLKYLMLWVWYCCMCMFIIHVMWPYWEASELQYSWKVWCKLSILTEV